MLLLFKTNLRLPGFLFDFPKFHFIFIRRFQISAEGYIGENV